MCYQPPTVIQCDQVSYYLCLHKEKSKLVNNKFKETHRFQFKNAIDEID